MNQMPERGFALLEMAAVVAIVGVLATVAVKPYVDYSRKAKLSEAIMAAGACRTAVTEKYRDPAELPAAGNWGCESPAGVGKYVREIATSHDGAVRVAVTRIGGNLDGQFVYLQPVALVDGVPRPMSVDSDMGTTVAAWHCAASNKTLQALLRNACTVDSPPPESSTWRSSRPA